MHSLLMMLALVGVVVVRVNSGKIVFPESHGPYPHRSYPGRHRPGRPGQSPRLPGQRPELPGQHPGFPGQQPGLPGSTGQQPGLPGQHQKVHHVGFGSQYHYSWRTTKDIFTWDQANSYCKSLPGRWQSISIETPNENNWVASVLRDENLDYIWTSGTADGLHNFSWGNGARVISLNWSHTGSQNRAQPDNYENNNEKCLAVLNNFYNDGIKWHDVACYHPKPVICERKLLH